MVLKKETRVLFNSDPWSEWKLIGARRNRRFFPTAKITVEMRVNLDTAERDYHIVIRQSNVENSKIFNIDHLKTIVAGKKSDLIGRKNLFVHLYDGTMSSGYISLGSDPWVHENFFAICEELIAQPELDEKQSSSSGPYR